MVTEPDSWRSVDCPDCQATFGGRQEGAGIAKCGRCGRVAGGTRSIAEHTRPDAEHPDTKLFTHCHGAGGPPSGSYPTRQSAIAACEARITAGWRLRDGERFGGLADTGGQLTGRLEAETGNTPDSTGQRLTEPAHARTVFAQRRFDGGYWVYNRQWRHDRRWCVGGLRVLWRSAGRYPRCPASGTRPTLSPGRAFT